MRRTFILVVLLAASSAAYACSEATDGVRPEGVAFGGGPDAAAASSAAGCDVGPAGVDAMTASSSAVLINEISGSGEWIEIVNSSASAVDLSGWSVADRDKATGGPKLAEAVTFPDGTSLPAGAYGMVRGGGLGDAGKACPDGGQTFCLHAEFGISNKSGETVFLLGPDAGVLGSVVYPPDAAHGDDAWGRLPNGDINATFELSRATPGAPNQPR